MVSHDCIHRVCFAMRANVPQFHNHDPDMLGMLLVELNRRSLKARYGYLQEVEPYSYREPEHVGSMAIMQIFKSVRCFVYQCAEGDVPDEPLFEQARHVRDRMSLALGYDEELPSNFKQAAMRALYDECEWG